MKSKKLIKKKKKRCKGTENRKQAGKINSKQLNGIMVGRAREHSYLPVPSGMLRREHLSSLTLLLLHACSFNQELKEMSFAP